MTGYAHHYTKAQEEFVDWFYKSHEDPELASFWFSNCGCIGTMMSYDDELKFALEAFDESEQVKIVYEYATVGHLLKIKWEVNPWWPNQVLHFYYCVMYPIDDITMQFPHEIGEEE